MKTIPVSLSISRPSYGDGRKKISIRIRDELSRIEFIDMEIDLEHFAEALTGLSSRPAEAVIRGVEYLGMTRVTEKRQIVCPLTSLRREKYVEWLEANAQEDGWLLNSSLGSQSSVKSMGSETLLNYSVTKYVEP